MILEVLDKSNIDSLYELGLQEFKGELWFTKDFLRETLGTPGYYLGAFENGNLIGGILVRKFDRPKLWIFFLIIDSDYRRQGIGSKLLRKIEELGSRDHNFLFVDVSEDDVSANKFYSKLGFERNAKVKNWFGDNTFGLIYTKKLNC